MEVRKDTDKQSFSYTILVAFVLLLAVMANMCRAGGKVFSRSFKPTRTVNSKVFVNNQFTAVRALGANDQVRFLSRGFQFPFAQAATFKTGIGATGFAGNVQNGAGIGGVSAAAGITKIGGTGTGVGKFNAAVLSGSPFVDGFGNFNNFTFGLNSIQSGIINGYGSGGYAGFSGTSCGAGGVSLGAAGNSIYGYGQGYTPNYRGYAQLERASSKDFLDQSQRILDYAQKVAELGALQAEYEHAQEAQLNKNFKLQGKLIPKGGGPPLDVEGFATQLNVNVGPAPLQEQGQQSGLVQQYCGTCHIQGSRGDFNLLPLDQDKLLRSVSAIHDGSMPKDQQGSLDQATKDAIIQELIYLGGSQQ